MKSKYSIDYKIVSGRVHHTLIYGKNDVKYYKKGEFNLLAITEIEDINGTKFWHKEGWLHRARR